MSAWRKQAIDLIDELILQHQIKSVFEVGCDDAGISRNLAAKYPNIKFDGVDFREDKINDANLMSEQNNLVNTQFSYDYFLNFETIESQYDVVIFTEVYEHLVAENQMYALRLLGNLLLDNGFIVFTCPNGDYMFSYLESEKDFDSRYDQNFFENIYQTEHWLEPTHKEIKKIFISLGFDIVKAGYFNLPKRRIIFIEKLELLLKRIPFFRNWFFKSQYILAKKNPNSPLLKQLNLYQDS
jgi:cyclopropane fatty-acyl-phospholipid synthase-like methyltransferase